MSFFQAATETATKPRDAGYEQKRQREGAKQREKSAAARDIGPDFPDVANPDRRAKGKASLQFFCETYGKRTFALAWSPDHLDVIRAIETTVLNGGQYALAMPRGSGKTSIVLWACLWAILNGHQQYLVLIGATQGAAKGLLEQLKDELESNELLLEDYPEVCYPIAKLEGVNQRRLLFHGEPIKMTFTKTKIVLPNIPGSIASGSVIGVAGLTGALRGLNHRLPTGEKIRPGMVLLDDPQTDVSALSPQQCEKREKLIVGAVLGLAGPGKTIAAVMCCTVIALNDLSERFLDHDKHPEWHGKRTALLKSFPKLEGEQLEALMSYADSRAQGLAADDGGKLANAAYRKLAAVIEKGIVASWPARKLAHEVNAIQHALNLYLTDKFAFFAEYQNDPAGAQSDDGTLSVAVILSRTHGHPRRVVPPGVVCITAGIDVQGELLYWAVVAWEACFTGYVLDYGSWPDQQRPYFTYRDARKTLSRQFKGASKEGRIYQGLQALTVELLSRDYVKEDGEQLRIERAFIDEGFEAETVRKYCGESGELRQRLMPSKGWGKPLRPHPSNRVEQGDGWQIPPVARGRIVRECNYDSSLWTTFVRKRLQTVPGQRGALTFWAENPTPHKMIADHIDSEVRVGIKIDNQGGQHDVWELRPGRPDNHLADTLKMSAVAAASTRKVKLALNDSPLARPAGAKRKKKPAKCYDLKED